jgi:hypothetical protein
MALSMLGTRRGNVRQGEAKTGALLQKFKCAGVAACFLLIFAYCIGPDSDPTVVVNSFRSVESAPKWDPSKCVVIGLAVGYGLNVYEMFVGSLRATGYPGHIILGISPDAPDNVRKYLIKARVQIKEVSFTNCTYPVGKCALGYPDYKIQWGRFAFAGDWLRECKECTDGVMLTDVRDAYFQLDPFAAVKDIHPIMVFEEISDVTTNHWVSDAPIFQCKGIHIKDKPMLCSGSTMGTREGILNYTQVMVQEFDAWIHTEKCRSDNIFDDQSIHNYLYYTNQLPGAVAIPHRSGSIHVVGYQANVIFRKEIEKARERGEKEPESWVNSHPIYGTGKNWREWLPSEHNLTDKNGFITNLGGSPSAQVHQIDRFGHTFIRFWLYPMVKEWKEKYALGD